MGISTMRTKNITAILPIITTLFFFATGCNNAQSHTEKVGMDSSNEKKEPVIAEKVYNKNYLIPQSTTGSCLNSQIMILPVCGL